MAQLLDDEDIDDALAALPGWRRDDNKLVREVPVEDDSRDNLERAIMTVADELDHHPVVGRGDGRLRLEVWTHSDGGITARDVELAGRIDQALSGPVQD